LAALATMGCQSTGGSSTGTGATGSEFREESVGGESGSGRELPLQTIYFDFDDYSIREDAKPALRTNAQSIKEHGEWGTVTVEGHCDERGSEEYNLALGERRANGVKRYLVDMGVPATRLSTVSFGEAKPSVSGHDESAWRYNRRSEFKSGR
jgi:peptidoglycan-associated lipoprotein